MRELPDEYTQNTGKTLFCIKGATTVHAKKNVSTQTDPLFHVETPDQEKSKYPSNSYQKVLDYHIAEILLSTIVLAVIALIRLHR